MASVVVSDPAVVVVVGSCDAVALVTEPHHVFVVLLLLVNLSVVLGKLNVPSVLEKEVVVDVGSFGVVVMVKAAYDDDDVVAVVVV